MKKISFIHIGDIHCGIIDPYLGEIDVQDSTFPLDFLNIGREENKYSIIKRRLISELRANSYRFICFSGDLSNKGEQKNYEKCILFFSKHIPKQICAADSPKRIFIVPGNHDIAEAENVNDSCKKFEPIVKILQKYGFPTIPINDAIIEEMFEKDAGNVLICALNSCILSRTKNQTSGEVVDYPKILDTDIKKLQIAIKQLNANGKNFCLLILSHHNLLPQKIPRIKQYAELLNAGNFRESLLSFNIPILYLHGHIHDNPVEVISCPVHLNSKLVLSSAPLLLPTKENGGKNKFGYAKIDILYSDDQIPLGCQLNFITNNEDDEKILPIKFFNPFYADRHLNQIDKELLISLRSLPTPIYVSDLITHLTGRSIHYSSEELQESVERLYWYGLIDYRICENDNFKSRIIKAVIP